MYFNTSFSTNRNALSIFPLLCTKVSISCAAPNITFILTLTKIECCEEIDYFSFSFVFECIRLASLHFHFVFTMATHQQQLTSISRDMLNEMASFAVHHNNVGYTYFLFLRRLHLRIHNPFD